MIETKLYKVMLRRMSMTLLMVLLSAATVYADQTVKVVIEGSDNVKGWSLKVDGTTIEFTDGCGLGQWQSWKDCCTFYNAEI